MKYDERNWEPNTIGGEYKGSWSETLTRRTWNSGFQASIKAVELKGTAVRKKSQDNQGLLKLCDGAGRC